MIWWIRSWHDDKILSLRCKDIDILITEPGSFPWCGNQHSREGFSLITRQICHIIMFSIKDQSDSNIVWYFIIPNQIIILPFPAGLSFEDSYQGGDHGEWLLEESFSKSGGQLLWQI